MSTGLRELLAVFSIDVDPEKNLEQFDKKIEEFAEHLGKIAKTIAEVFGAEKLYEFIKTQVEVNSHLQDLSNRLGVSAGDIRNFGFVAKDAGVDLDAAANALGLLEKNIGKATTGGKEASKAFAAIGLSTADLKDRDLTDVLGDVAEGIAALPDQNQRAAASMELLGKSGRALIPVFAKGREAFEDAMKEAAELGNGLGDELYEDTKRAADGFEHYAHVLESLKDRALAAILPAVELLGVLLKDAAVWLLELDKKTHLVQAAFITLAFVVGALLVDALGTAAVALWALISPFLVTFGPVIAAVAGLVWIIQDLWNLMTGGPSIIGDIIEKLGGVGDRKKAVGQLHEAFTALVDGIAAATFGVAYFVGALVGLGQTAGGNDSVLEFFLAVIKVSLSATRLVGGFFGMVTHSIAGLGLATAALLQGLPMDEAMKQFSAAGKSADSAGNAVFGKNGILGEAGIGQHSTDVRDYGVSADSVGRHAKTFERGNGSDVSAANEPSKEASAPHVGGGIAGPLVFRAPHVGGSTAPVALTVHNSFTVHTKSDKPKEVGDETGTAVASHTAKAMRNALASRVKA